MKIDNRGNSAITAAAQANFSKHDAPVAARRGEKSHRSVGDVRNVFQAVGDNFKSSHKLAALGIALHSNRSGHAIDTIYDAIGRDFNQRDKIEVAREGIHSGWRAGALANLFDRIGDNVNDRNKLERVRDALDGHRHIR